MTMNLVYIFKNIYLISNKNVFSYKNFLTVIHVRTWKQDGKGFSFLMDIYNERVKISF